MTNKTCPFHQGITGQPMGLYVDARLKKCDGVDCQLWVNVVQGRIFTDGKMKIADQDYEYRYEGCGLVQTIPWALVKKEEGEKKDE